MPNLGERIRDGFNAFMGRAPTYPSYYGSSTRPDRTRLSIVSARSIVNSIYNRIAIDVAEMDIKHVRLDEEGNYAETLDTQLNSILSSSANLDQTGRELIQDAVMSMFDEGCVAIVPIDTNVDPSSTDTYKIYSARTAKIVEWLPYHIRVEAYDERVGRKGEFVIPKSAAVIVENPFYSIMNEPNSILQRLVRVLSQLDKTNESNSSSKLDLIVKLPYLANSKIRQTQAEERRKNLEAQLSGSQLGIGYIDATEQVIQLNRAVENNLWSQAKELQADLYNQLGLTQSIFDGTADEAIMLNYYDRTIKPIMNALTEEIERKWISKNARTRGQAIRYFKDPFRLTPPTQLAEIADKFTRNEIMTSNELRAIIGLKPSSDPRANMLINSNLNHDESEFGGERQVEEDTTEDAKNQNV